MRKWVYALVAIVAGAVVLQPMVVALVDYHQARQNAVYLAQQATVAPPGGRVAVVYYSRSGNTAVMAQRIAQRVHATLYRLEAPDYQLGLIGWAKALVDARNREAVISPSTIDLSAYDSVYLGSPIWMYSPAPPIWQFVDLNRLDNKNVVLFNTFNSKFEPEYIDAFKARVMERGALSFEHRYIRRGRMGQQLSREELLQAVDAMWPESNTR